MIVKMAAFVIPLGFDTLAVAVLLGLRGMSPLRPALTFAVFESVMPLIGLLLGRLVGASFKSPAVVLGGLVLLAVATYMVKEALEDQDETDRISFVTMHMALLAGFGISMDELAIGFPMGTSGLPVPATLAAIAVQAFLVTVAGIALGRRLGADLGRHTSRTAGLVAAGAFGILGVYLIVQRLVRGLPDI